MTEGDSDFEAPPKVKPGEVLELQTLANQHYESQATKLLRLLIAILGITFTAIFYINQSGLDLLQVLNIESRTTVIQTAVPHLNDGGDSFLVVVLILLVVWYGLWGVKSYTEILQSSVGVLEPERVRATISKEDLINNEESVQTLISRNESIVESTHDAWLESYEKLRLTGTRFVIAGLGASIYLLNDKLVYWILFPFFIGLVSYRVWRWAPTKEMKSYLRYHGTVELPVLAMLALVFIIGQFHFSEGVLNLVVGGALILLTIITIYVFKEYQQKPAWSDWHMRNALLVIFSGIAYYITFLLTMIFVFPIDQNLVVSSFSSIFVTWLWTIGLSVISGAFQLIFPSSE